MISAVTTDDCRCLHDTAGWHRQAAGPGQDGVTDRCGKLIGFPGKHLGDEERVAAGAAMQGDRVDVSIERAGQLGYGPVVSRGSCIRVTAAAVARSPIVAANGCVPSISSSRNVATTSSGSPLIRRPR